MSANCGLIPLVKEISANGDVDTPSVYTPIESKDFSKVLITPNIPIEPVSVFGLAMI